jgi:uncharacterized membrane-anchored protein
VAKRKPPASALIDVMPKRIEEQLAAVLADVQTKLATLEPAVRDAPALVAELRRLVAEVRIEVAALKAIRERNFRP